MVELAQRRLVDIDDKYLLGLFSLLGLLVVQGIVLASQRATNLTWAMFLLAWVFVISLIKFRWGVVLALSLMLFTGFLNRVTYNLEDVNFQFLFAFPVLVTAMLAGVWTLRFLATGERTMRLYPALDIWALAYASVMLAQVVNPKSSVVIGLYGARIELVPICMYFFSRFYFRGSRDITRFYKLLILLGVIVVAYGLFQHIWGLPDLEFTWIEHNPPILAQKTLSVGTQMGWYIDGKPRVFSFLNGGQEYNFLIVMFFILLFVYNPLRRGEVGWRVGRILFLILYITFLALSLERMPIAMVVIGLLTAFVVRGPIKHKRTFVLLVLITLLAGSALVALRVAQDHLLALTSGNIFARRLIEIVSPFSATAVRAGRFHHWEHTLQLITQNPLGYGLGSALQNRATEMTGIEGPHNYFLRMTLELGVAGITLMVVLFARIIRLAMRQMLRMPQDMKLLLRALLGIMAAIIACGMFNNPLLDAVGYYFWFFVGLIPVLSESQNWKSDSSEDLGAGL